MLMLNSIPDSQCGVFEKSGKGSCFSGGTSGVNNVVVISAAGEWGGQSC